MSKNKKLTLYIDDEIIDRAKRFAEDRGTSVSDLVERYLDDVCKSGDHTDDRVALELPLSFEHFYGVISLPEDFDEKREAVEHRIKKHS